MNQYAKPTATPSGVAELQTLLNASMSAGLAVDGDLGPLTEAALHRFQSQHGLPQSGKADAATLLALNEAVAAGSRNQALSAAGRQFIYAHESQRGVSDHLYWPGGDSGVTLGAGYDMRERGAAAIAAELALLGLAAAVCGSAAKAAGLADSSAEDFVDANAELLCLTPAQETDLLRQTVPPYEEIVRRDITVPLTQSQFDALVSFVYNPGGSFAPVAALINAGNPEAAMGKIKRRVFSGRLKLDALVRRRNDEAALYLTGHYGDS